MTETTNIYILIDPVTDCVRYVGKANNVHKRYFAHLKDRRTHHRSCWIKGLSNKGLKPIVEVVDTVSKNEWQFWEKYYISLFKSWGFDLTNVSEGGEGSEHTEETRKRMSDRKKGKPILHLNTGKRSAEHIENLRLACIGKKDSAEAKLNKSLSAKTKPVLQFNLKGEFMKEWRGVNVAARELGISSVKSNVAGKTKTAGGFIFKHK